MDKPSATSGSAARATGSKRKPRTGRITPGQRVEGNERPINNHWRTFFLQKLAETSNVSASATSVGASTSRAYKTRREDPGFAAQWRAALLEGYDHLEMDVLGYLRNPAPEAKMDVGGAIKLLAMHAQTVARERALADNRDEREVLDSIDAMIDQMRERAAANAATIAQMAADENDADE